MIKQKQSEIYDAQKKANAQARLNELMSKDWSLVADPFADISAAELSHLHANCQGFKEAESRVETIAGFRRMTAADQEKFFAACNESTRILLEADGYISAQIQTLAGSPEEAQALIDSKREAEQARLFEENRAAVELAERETKLYPGVEIIGGKHRLSLDPGDGTAAEVFWGDSQKEVFQKLAESKRNATRELRRRSKAFKVTSELRAMTPEIVSYPPLEVKVTLTPEQLFDAHSMLANPETAVEGTRLLAAAARTPEEIARGNEFIIRSRMTEASNIAATWVRENPDFFECVENVQALMDALNKLNWACTSFNLSLAFDALKEQGILVDRLPETEVETTAFVRPKPRPAFVPRAAAPSPAAPVAPQPTAPLRRPTNGTSLNGGSTSSARLEKFGKVTVAPMTAAEYHAISSSDMKTLYGKDANFKDRVDAYWQAGGR
jgi:hypothetical protein